MVPGYRRKQLGLSLLSRPSCQPSRDNNAKQGAFEAPVHQLQKAQVSVLPNRPHKPGPRTGLAATFGPEARKSGSGAGAPSSGKEPRRKAACPVVPTASHPTRHAINRTDTTKKGHANGRHALSRNLIASDRILAPAWSKTSSLRTPLQSASTLKLVGILGSILSDQPRTCSEGREQRTSSTSSGTFCRSGA